MVNRYNHALDRTRQLMKERQQGHAGKSPTLERSIQIIYARCKLMKNAILCTTINNLHVVDNGVEAMAFLRHQGQYTAVPRPDLILLDLNLPKKDGREVLAEIKTDENLRLIPVVILTTSKDEQDVLKAYGLHANCYIVKPVDFEQFAAVVQAIEHFWFTVVTYPSA